jgi:hypothetical protein
VEGNAIQAQALADLGEALGADDEGGEVLQPEDLQVVWQAGGLQQEGLSGC